MKLALSAIYIVLILFRQSLFSYFINRYYWIEVISFSYH
jgi:hypothetical protein